MHLVQRVVRVSRQAFTALGVEEVHRVRRDAQRDGLVDAGSGIGADRGHEIVAASHADVHDLLTA